VGRYVVERGVNVIAQLVAKRSTNQNSRFSLSCNTDMTLDLLRVRAEGKAHFKLIGQVNSSLPFMPGDGNVTVESFSHVLEAPRYDFPLFAPPNEPVNLAEYAKGFHVARLVPDGGKLQIGIGQGGARPCSGARSFGLRRAASAFRSTITNLSISVFMV